MIRRTVGSTRVILPLLLVLLSLDLVAQERTVGVLLNTEEASTGYTLFAPIRSTTTWLIDMEGRIVRTWESEYRPGNMVYLRDNGHLLRSCNVGGVQGDFGFAGGAGGVLQEFDWEGNLLWEYRYADDRVRQHHDAIGLPSGNVLFIAWELVTPEEAIALGRDPSTIPEGGIWADHIVEVQPVGPDGGEIVWEWHAIDHLIQDFDDTKPNYGTIADHPELIDFNHSTGRNAREDWMHVNGLDYNAELDQIVISAPSLNEVMIIDHSTTTEEARGSSGGDGGRGGDLLYRWGNPAGYDAGVPADQQLYFQHNPGWIPEGYPGAGNILVFNNGQGRPDGTYSSVVEFTPPLQEDGTYGLTPGLPFPPSEPVWTWAAPVPEDFYSATLSGAQRMPNGNTLISAGETGHLIEVTSAGEVVWEYVSPVTSTGILTQGETVEPRSNLLFRAVRYSTDHPGLSGRDLTPGDFVERYSSGVEVTEGGPERLDID